MNDNGSNFLGGASFALTDRTSFTYITTWGNFGSRGVGSDQYSHSMVLDTAISDTTNWVLQSDYVDDNVATQYGLNNYFVQTVNDQLAYGLRTEWWRNAGASFFEVTAGVNYKSHANVVIRPELRYDWSPQFDLKEFTAGIDAIFTF